MTDVIAGTGHRPNKLGGYTHDATDRLVRFARHILAQNDPDTVISGMALGWDTALAIAALDMGCPLTCAIPFAGQERMWPASSQNQYNLILSRASKVHIVSPGDYASWKMQVRNEWMVDNCTLLLALWNGSPGGTGNCVRYAQSKSRTLIENVWPEWDTFK